jgi:chemotaxis protein CheY-P-specific phosphatase CheC
MDKNASVWDSLTAKPDTSLKLSLATARVSRSLSETIGQPIRNDAANVATLPIASVASRLGDPTETAVGVGLQIRGDAQGQALLILSWSDALKFVDLMMAEEPGTTTNMGFEERSALAEVGNLALASFLNVLATSDRLPLRLMPSTPDVIVDRRDRIVQLVLIHLTSRRSDVQVIDTVLRSDRGSVQAHFLVFPHQAAHYETARHQ